ncbi:hypothetical protein [Streptomyces olivoreticuli]|uniref:hypothetical protein n=1 Tax=Streptomyces olivoreticuli TaxID=68246 RepID=UPI001967E75D|nr:hypothetical protein [Streptomyces olivoreticuli]
MDESVKVKHLPNEAPNYIRLMDTPRVWGRPFGPAIMQQSWARQGEFQRALEEVVQKSRYRCDIASLNAPDPAWAGIILGAMDTALSQKILRPAPTQFRFLFGQTPTALKEYGAPENYTLLKQAVIRMVRERSRHWTHLPEIWLGRYYQMAGGIAAAINWKLFGDVVEAPDERMTWNHSKIIVADATEVLAGGHNLNMDLFLSYPPVHDLSVVVHGPAAADAHTYLDKMWACGKDLLAVERLEALKSAKPKWEDHTNTQTRPANPLKSPNVIENVRKSQREIVELHQGVAPAVSAGSPSPVPRDQYQVLDGDLDTDVFPVRQTFAGYDALGEYKLATRYGSVGKYWSKTEKGGYEDDSGKMKEDLILGAERTIKMSQMDLISAWKKNWKDHVVCHSILKALLEKKDLTVQVVVSPLDAGAGAGGDQYSFGSGAVRTFSLMRYYMLHDVETDAEYPDQDRRLEALSRLFIAPFYYTDVPSRNTVEGKTYKWPHLPTAGFTATLKQPPLSERRPKEGVIGDAYEAAQKGKGFGFDLLKLRLTSTTVPSAPGNHAKLMVIDDEVYVVGSDNLYPGFLSEFNYVIEGEEAVADLLENYWNPLWGYASRHALSGGRPGSCCGGPDKCWCTRDLAPRGLCKLV